jgi:hypothetical protein
MVDSTNFAGVNWTAYTSSTITANLGGLEGWHDTSGLAFAVCPQKPRRHGNING